MPAINNLFSLTDFTGRRATKKRTVIVSGFEINAAVVRVVLWSALPVLIVAGVIALIAGPWSVIFSIPILYAGVLWLIESRTKEGLRLRRYQAYLDQRRSVVDNYFVCGSPISIGDDEYANATKSSVGVRWTDRRVLTDAFDSGARPRPVNTKKPRDRSTRLEDAFR